MDGLRRNEKMSSSAHSPEVITSIAFGIFASALGVAQLVVSYIRHKHRNRRMSSSESVTSSAALRFADNTEAVAGPQSANFRPSSYFPSPLTSVLIVAVVDISAFVLE